MTPPSAKQLRSGFTTGTAAAAASKAALIWLTAGNRPASVAVRLLTGDVIDIVVHDGRVIDDSTAYAEVIKDAGDDPDVTHKARIGARVTLATDHPDGTVTISGGKGVGKVTKPGLETPPGQPAITSGPRRMITEAVAGVLSDSGTTGGVSVEVVVPDGETLALKTLNARLGIVGGISILGTTGVVRPMSHEAYVATIDAALSVARATGHDRVVLTTGRRSERFAQHRWPALASECFVQMGDFFAEAMERAADKGFAQIVIAVFFGKAVKMAQGIGHTHARTAALTLDRLARWAEAAGADTTLAGQIRSAHTARHAFEFIAPALPALIQRVGAEVAASARRFSHDRLAVRVVIFDFEGRICADTAAGRKEGRPHA